MPILLQINFVINSGSTGRIAEGIGETVISEGWESYIAYGRNDAPSQSRKIDFGCELSSFVHAVGSILLDAQGLFSTIQTRKLIKDIRRINPDIIHLHNIHGDYLNYVTLFDFLAEADIPVVWSFHDCWPMTGHCSHFTYVDCDRWKTQCHDCPQLRMYPRSILLDRSRSNYRLKKKHFTSVRDLTLVPVSNWLGGLMRESFFKGKPIHRVYNGVDIDVFKPRDSREEVMRRYGLDCKFLIVGVANIWSGRKGFDDFLELSKIIGDDMQILMVGLKQKQIDILPPNIKGLRRTESVEELSSIYSAADIFINPSPEETFGLTTVESMACGTPAVVYNSTANPEIVTPETGFVVEPKHIEGLMSAIDQVRKKGKATFSAECRARVKAHFNKEDRFKEYYDLYKSILDRRKKES